MACLNSDGKFWSITTYEHEIWGSNWRWEKPVNEDYVASELVKHLNNNFYYLHITTGSLRVHNLSDLFTDSQINEMMTGKALLVINLNCESHIADILESIWEEIIIKHQIKSDSVIFITESHNIGKYAYSVAEKFKCSPFKIKHVNYVEMMSKPQENYNHKPLEFSNIKKCFLNFNRFWRPHRVALVSLLVSYGLLEKGYVSLSKTATLGSPFSSLKDFYDNRNQYIRNQNLLKVIECNKEKIINIGDLVVDIEDLSEVVLIGETDRTLKYYESSYFSLVTETNFYGNTDIDQSSVFITEKIFRPMVHFQPFMVLSTFNYLKYLREKGYKTFHPYIDESYDDEEDDDLRMIKIINEVRRLCSFSDDQIKQFIEDCKPICIHNYNLLTTRQLTFTDLV